MQDEDDSTDRADGTYQWLNLGLAERVIGDTKIVLPESEVIPLRIDFKDSWDSEEV